MTERQVGVGFQFQDHTRPIAGDEGSPALQSQSKLVTRSGATQAVADIDIDGHDLTGGDFGSGKIDIGGTAALSTSIASQQGNQFEVKIDLIKDDGTVLRTVDSAQYSDLKSNDVNLVVPVFSDRVEIRVTDTSGAPNNDIDGSINANTGGPTTIQATLQSSSVIVEGEDGIAIAEETLNSAADDTDEGLVTYLSRALDSRGLDQLHVDVENYNAGNLPTTLESNNAGTLQTEQQSPVGVENEAGEQIDPDSADAAYANGVTLTGNSEVTRTLVARGGDDLVGRVQSSGSYDVEARYQDDNGNTIYTDTVASGVAGGNTTELGPNDTTVDAASDHIVIAIVDTSGSDQTANAVLHYN